ncbi:hypothetical protein [Sediminicola luteus]|nr:hypothetical protein [Sediminicola luteus]
MKVIDLKQLCRGSVWAILLLFIMGPMETNGQYFGEGPVTLNTPAGASNIQWYQNGTAIPGANGSSFTTSNPATYHAEYLDASTTCQNDKTVLFVLKNGNDPVVLSGNPGADTYQWSNENGPIVGGQSQNLTVTEGGSYSLETNQLGCSSISQEYYVFNLCSSPFLFITPPSCNVGTNTYSVTFVKFPETTVNIVGGIDNGDNTATANLGDSMQFTATAAGGCFVQQSVQSPTTCPLDLGIVFKIADGIVNGEEEQVFLIRVRELVGHDSDGSPVEVRIDKLPDLQIDYQSNLGRIDVSGQTTPLNNSDWVYDGSEPDFHVFRNNQIISGGSTTTFGFKATFDPGASRGKIPVSARIVHGSGGEVGLDNNIDTETLAFFPK